MIGEILRRAREDLGLDLGTVAQVLGVSQEALSRWERGEGLPPTLHLDRLARLYGLDEGALLRGEARPRPGPSWAWAEGAPIPPEARLALEDWLRFLDGWADFLGEAGELPRKASLADGTILTDRRRASREARRAREALGLGLGPLPDPWTLLDGLGILVYRASLGKEGGIWGAYYPHPRLGGALLVNADATPSRQPLALAHGLAHVLYHGAFGPILCRREAHPAEREVEAFADAWAAHFLLPAPALRKEVGKLRRLSPQGVLFLAAHFRLPYILVLFRPFQEGLIPEETLGEWARLDQQGLAQAIGLPPDPFPHPVGEGGLYRFPPSVLIRVREAVQGGALSPSEAAGLLDLDSTTVMRELLPPPKEAEVREEYPELLRLRRPGRKPRS